MGTAILGLLGTVVGAVSDKTQQESEAEIQAWMNHNKDLMSSNTLPLLMIGGMVSVALVAVTLRGKGERR